MSQHHAKFTWGAGPNAVFIAGNFNSWSDSATPLHKLDDGSFAAEVPLPWGEKQAFKYVVDGEWKVREDEAKEWDAAGNMNNVYTAPHAPAPATATSTAAAATTSTSAPAKQAVDEKSASTGAAAPASTDNAPPSVAPAAAAATTGAEAAAPPASADKNVASTAAPTEPSTLLASSAPKAASSGPAPVLGAPVTGSTTDSAAQPVTATAAIPIEDAPAVYEPTPVKIEKAAANANIGQAPTGDEEPSIKDIVAEYGAGALAAIGVAAGGAVAAVENVTGVDLGHGNPLTVEEAKAKGIDVNSLPKKDAEVHAASPVGVPPPASAVEALEEKTRELKVSTGAQEQAAVPLPNGNGSKASYDHAPAPLPTTEEVHSKHDLPAQNQQADKHKEVPAPVITPVAPKDPKKDRTLDAPVNADSAVTKPISADPGISAREAKKEAETHPGGTGSTLAAAQGIATPTPSGVPEGTQSVRPDAPNDNYDVNAPPTPAKAETDTPAVAAAPATPAKDVAPTSATSTPASTPAKPAANGKDTNGTHDVRKRKSSFFTKIKHAFSPKDKEKK